MIEAGFSERVRRDHLEGQTVFVDDQLPRQGTLETLLVTSPYARAAVTHRGCARPSKCQGCVV